MTGDDVLDLDVDGYRVERLGPADAAVVQRLYERCSDYHQLEEGIPTRPGAAAHLLAALPPGREAADKYVLGVRAPGGELVGVMDLIRDCPDRNEWWLGLLMLDPDVRGSGLGGRLYRAVEQAVRSGGATSIYLGVLEQNPSAERFWRSHGFQELRRQPYTAASGHQSRVIVMRHRLA
ncbi:MAG: GNAT family N-acetyltransferase [Gemmatimonadetes bacterium]|nr:GNAT family N-acetyltransferase [Gemmatimonadota bacterium]